MEVILTPELEALVNEKVRSGLYTDASDVFRDALRALEQRADLESASLESALLEGVRGKHSAYGPGTLDQVREMARRL